MSYIGEKEWTITFVISEINNLAKIKKQRDLTQEEISYREKLKHYYIKTIRSSVEQQLNSVKFVDDTNLENEREGKNEK